MPVPKLHEPSSGGLWKVPLKDMLLGLGQWLQDGSLHKPPFDTGANGIQRDTSSRACLGLQQLFAPGPHPAAVSTALSRACALAAFLREVDGCPDHHVLWHFTDGLC